MRPSATGIAQPWNHQNSGGIVGSVPNRPPRVTPGRAGVFKGNIDDVRIYNRALSADEIKRLYLIGR